jgi:hypothetical protein
LLFQIDTAQTCPLVKPLLSSGCSIFSYLLIVAQQRVYMPQYFWHHKHIIIIIVIIIGKTALFEP